MRRPSLCHSDATQERGIPLKIICKAAPPMYNPSRASHSLFFNPISDSVILAPCDQELMLDESSKMSHDLLHPNESHPNSLTFLLILLFERLRGEYPHPPTYPFLVLSRTFSYIFPGFG
jgi:hypothetical protein